MEYTFADGAVARVDNRNIAGCGSDFVTYLHGTRCAAHFSGAIHKSDAHTFQDQRLDPDRIAWQSEPEPRPLHQYEWEVLLDAIINDKPHNETERSIYANLAAVHGQGRGPLGSYDHLAEALDSDFEFVSNVDDLDYDSPAPVQADEEGRYPAPSPASGRKSESRSHLGWATRTSFSGICQSRKPPLRRPPTPPQHRFRPHRRRPWLPQPHGVNPAASLTRKPTAKSTAAVRPIHPARLSAVARFAGATD